ncbi:terminase TerL endonuclease subunit [Aeromonas hydrophila]|uniref:terminase TerL endonuclease subunit n=1 Tax=Aeromonas hydrophila TaxID=644 RepID=UPI002ED0F2E5|nr:terminase TerL endonuclease subunit [Aeromonas hydrophila]
MRDLESLNHRVLNPDHRDPMGNTLNDKYCISLEGGEQYAYDVITGAINTSPYIKGACERYLRDLNRTDIYQNKKRIKFTLGMTMQMRFPKGASKGKPMTISDWQVFFLINTHGWYYSKTHEDPELRNRRRFKYTALWVGRGNAKSTLASAVMIVESLTSINQDAYIISAGPGLKQSQICIDSMKSYINLNPDLKSMFNMKNKLQTVARHNGVIARAAVQGKSKLDGFRVTLACLDELHGHPDGSIKNELQTGMGGDQIDSLMLMISTAGWNTQSFAAREMEYGRQVSMGEVIDDRYFALVYAVPPEYKDQYDNEKLWEWANPNLGKSVSISDIRSICVKAKQGYLEDRNSLLTRYMNIYSDENNDSYINVHDLSKCRNRNLDIKNFAGKDCWIGLDLSSFRDLASVVYVFPEKDKLTAFQHSYISRGSFEVLPATDKDVMMEAKQAGELTFIESKVIDHDYIKKDIKEAYEKFNVKAFSLDAAALGQRFAEEIHVENKKIKPISVEQGYKLSFPIIRVKEFILTEKFEYNDTLLEYAFRNCVEIVGKLYGESRLEKKNEHHKIDPVISLCTSVASIPVWKAPRKFKVSGS